jgi:uncharacterized protein YjbI with pentapeptide repeats
MLRHDLLGGMPWTDLLRRDVAGFNRAARGLPAGGRIPLKGADLAGLRLGAAHLDRCDLTDADLTRAEVNPLRLARARLQRTRLGGSPGGALVG